MKINHRIKDLVGSATLAITSRAKELISQGKDVVNFAAGEPDFDTPDFIKKAAIKAIEDGFTKYTPTLGILPLREAISRKLQKDNGLYYKPSQIAVSSGAKQALYNVLQILADEGDEVLIPSPYWVSYPEMVKLSGARARILPTAWDNHFKITVSQLSESVSSSTRILILNSPSNPTGMVYRKKELEGIAQICVRKKIYVISDEIYEKLIYDKEVYTSIGSLGKDIGDLTITVNGFSKAYAMTGWRIGYCAGPECLIESINKLQDHTTSNPTSISQMAAVAALKDDETCIQSLREEFEKRRGLMMEGLNRIPKIRYLAPQGAFYIFCDVSKIADGTSLAKKILDEIHVAVIPGEGFGARDYIRLSFATSKEKIQEGMKRLSGWIKEGPWN